MGVLRRLWPACCVRTRRAGDVATDICVIAPNDRAWQPRVVGGATRLAPGAPQSIMRVLDGALKLAIRRAKASTRAGLRDSRARRRSRRPGAA